MNTLKVRREDAHLTQEDLAKLAKVPQATISRIERGATPTPGVDIAMRLASALGASVEDVFADVDPNEVADETTVDRAHEMVDPRPSVSP